jgi:hypothetical protein
MRHKRVTVVTLRQSASFLHGVLSGKGGERDRTSGLVVLLAGVMFSRPPSSGEENMARIGRKVIIAGVATMVIATGSGVAAAAVMSNGPVDSSGVIHGCWSNAELDGSHVFVLQDAGTSCPKNATAISWNQQGPAGPAGPEGAIGPVGPIGPEGPTGPTTAGPGGLNVTVVPGGDTGIGTQYDAAEAQCPASAPYVLGGDAVSVPPAGSLIESGPYDFTTGTPVTGAEVSGDAYGWRAEIPQGSQSTGVNGGLDMYAICST